MIFVMFGTQKHGFDRLLMALKKAIQSGVINEPVVIQIGHTKYTETDSKMIKVYQFLPKNEIEKYIKRASLIITHAGAGSIIESLMAGKKIIMVPRLKKYNEHVNDHQLEITDIMQANNYALACYEQDDLGAQIKKITKMQFRVFESQNQQFVANLKSVIDSINTSSIRRNRIILTSLILLVATLIIIKIYGR